LVKVMALEEYPERSLGGISGAGDFLTAHYGVSQLGEDGTGVERSPAPKLLIFRVRMMV